MENNNNYKIIIPSYKREKTIQEKTLNTLKQCKIPSNKINIFVANKEQYKIYKENIDETSYNQIIIGKKTIHQQRNYIRQYYNEGEQLFYLDDDIQGFYKLNKKKLEPFYKLNTLIKYGYHLMKKYHSNLMGVYPVFNHYFMSNTIHKGLFLVIGGAYWEINSKNKKLTLTDEYKEDYERSIKHYLQGNPPIRLNNITVKTNNYIEPGGLQETRTQQRITQSAYYLLKKYPQYITLNTSRKKHTEIKFKKQTNNQKIKIRI